MKLQGKTSLITGSGRGIGKNIAKRLSEEGSTVILTSRSTDQIDDVLNQIHDMGGQGIAIKCDITKFEQVKNMIDSAISKYSRIDILVNNVGIINPIGPFTDINPKEWKSCFETNFFGAYNVLKLVLPSMISNNYGKIINLSGGGAFNPFPNFSSYASSKAAIIRLTETLAKELESHNITINAISPGMTKTRMTEDILKSGETVGPEFEKAKKVMINGGADMTKILNLVLFLTSYESDGLSGKTIAAQWDDLEYIKSHISEIQNSDKFTMRRIVE